MPIANSNDLDLVMMSTVGITMMSMLLLLRELFNKSSEKVLDASDF